MYGYEDKMLFRTTRINMGKPVSKEQIAPESLKKFLEKSGFTTQQESYTENMMVWISIFNFHQQTFGLQVAEYIWGEGQKHNSYMQKK